jgi:hypothetical protein
MYPVPVYNADEKLLAVVIVIGVIVFLAVIIIAIIDFVFDK